MRGVFARFFLLMMLYYDGMTLWKRGSRVPFFTEGICEGEKQYKKDWEREDV